MLAVVAPVFAAGAVVYLAAAASFARSDPSAETLLGTLLLLAATTLAERYPVPVDGVDASGVSVGFVFGVAAIALFGWEVGVLVFATPQAVIQLWERRPPIRIAFNAGAFAVAAAAGGALVAPIDRGSALGIAACVLVAAFVQYWVNMVLVSGVIAANSGRAYFPLVRSNVRWTILPFTLMASASLILAVLWQRTPFLTAALAGPLIAIALYQRSIHKVLRAMRLALTDPLTGLGNHRHFHERLAQEIARVAETGAPLALCVLDVDDFKRINDGHGHPAGDRVLSQVAGRLRQDGEAFRLGGDEFAIVLAGNEEDDAAETARAIVGRIAALELDEIGAITVSAGIACFPAHAHELDELIRLADGALYWAKEHGKNRVHVSRADAVDLAELRRLARSPDLAARFRAASSLARAVDARDAYGDGHSGRVAELAADIARRMGLGAEEIELTRLAGSLRDLGKLAIPEEILRKPGPLSDEERLVLERHSQIGYRMLQSLGVDPIAGWVLHHHERWDGAGYPDGLPGEEIPLGARIVCVADAYDAMTSERTYRSRLTEEEALLELEQCADSQFDPAVVRAFAEELAPALAS